MFLPNFDVICDLLLNRRRATWNLYVNYTLPYDTVSYYTILYYTILRSMTENRLHEAGYFHAISRGSKLTVNLVQLSEPRQSADGIEPVLQAVNEIRSFQPDVILLYTKDKNIGLFVQQVIAVDYMSCFHLNTSP